MSERGTEADLNMHMSVCSSNLCVCMCVCGGEFAHAAVFKHMNLIFFFAPRAEIVTNLCCDIASVQRRGGPPDECL